MERVQWNSIKKQNGLEQSKYEKSFTLLPGKLINIAITKYPTKLL